MKELEDIENALSRLDATAVKGGVSRHFIEVRDNGEEVVVGGNKEGLVRLALELVRLAVKNQTGAHVHIDDVSLADVAERNLVLRVSDEPAV
jgi:hypothetical protein